MPIPNELTFSNEDELSQQFLIPLLRCLGFSVVANYHGHAEFGKDLVFAEIDRFGHVRYHAVQSKYLPSISLNAIEDLVLDCKQAFNNPFMHPQTGAVERISTFYAVNAGSIGPEATQHFFQSLVGFYGGNVRLLQAKDLLVLDQWATAQRHEQIIHRLTGLFLELRFNRRQIQAITNNYKRALDNKKSATYLYFDKKPTLFRNIFLLLFLQTKCPQTSWKLVGNRVRCLKLGFPFIECGTLSQTMTGLQVKHHSWA